MKLLTLLTFLLIGGSLLAQPEKVNQTDSQGRKQGVWKKPYPDVQVFKYVGQFKDDIPYGKFVYYYDTGEVEAVMNYSENGTVCRSSMYHRSGYLMARGKYINQEKDSIWFYYDDRGYLSYQEEYKGGQLNGQKIVYYMPVDGEYRVMRYENYKDGIRSGESKEYYDNKSLKKECVFVDGYVHGTMKIYYPTGELQGLFQYKNGKKHGWQIIYKTNGVEEGRKIFWEGVEQKGKAYEEKKELLRAQRGN